MFAVSKHVFCTHGGSRGQSKSFSPTPSQPLLESGRHLFVLKAHGSDVGDARPGFLGDVSLDGEFGGGPVAPMDFDCRRGQGET